jgi:hypothetical protein
VFLGWQMQTLDARLADLSLDELAQFHQLTRYMFDSACRHAAARLHPEPS